MSVCILEFPDLATSKIISGAGIPCKCVVGECMTEAAHTQATDDYRLWPGPVNVTLESRGFALLHNETLQLQMSGSRATLTESAWKAGVSGFIFLQVLPPECRYIHIYMLTFWYISEYRYIYIYIYTYMRTWQLYSEKLVMCIYIYICMCIYICVYIHKYRSTHVCVYLHIQIYVYIRAYVHINVIQTYAHILVSNCLLELHTIKLPRVHTVASRCPARYDLRCCKDIKLQHPSNPLTLGLGS